jgi:hypothetical protein
MRALAVAARGLSGNQPTPVMEALDQHHQLLAHLFFMRVVVVAAVTAEPPVQVVLAAAVLVNLAPEQEVPELQTPAAVAAAAVKLLLAPVAQVGQASLLFLFQRLNTLAL